MIFINLFFHNSLAKTIIIEGEFLVSKLSSLLCYLLSVGFAQVALARHSKSKLFLCTRLLATFSVICTLFSTKIVKMIPFLQMLKKDFQAI